MAAQIERIAFANVVGRLLQQEIDMRVNLELTEERVNALKALAEECGLSTQKELFNSALTLFEWAVNERRLGRTIASIDESTMKYKELAMPALQAVNRTKSSVGATLASHVA